MWDDSFLILHQCPIGNETGNYLLGSLILKALLLETPSFYFRVPDANSKQGLERVKGHHDVRQLPTLGSLIGKWSHWELIS